MSEHDKPQPNIQGGVALTPGHDPAADEVATGSRREQMHYEADPDQLVVARSTEPFEGRMWPEEQSEAVDEGRLPDEPYVGDARVAPEGPSVWDARPPAEEDDHERSGNPTGH